MSLKLMTWVFHESTAKGIDKLVLLAIADHAHDDGTSAYPGMTLLAKKAGVGKGTICRAVERLADLGELEVTDRQTTAKAGAKIGRGAKLAYRIITTGNVPERNDKKVPERDDTGSEGSADARKKVPLTSPPIEEEPSLSKNRKNTPPPASAAEPETEKATAQTLLKEHLDALGHDLVTKGRLASTIKGLITHGATTTEARAALTLMRQRNLTHPSVLAGLVDECRGQRNGSRNGDRRPPPEIPEADLTTRPPRHDPAAMMAWADRQLEEATRT